MDGHIKPMAQVSNRDRILSEGLKVVHARGFAGASVRDIVHAAGVPQGSFTNHFTSKEAFGLEILELYLANGRVRMAETLLNEDLPPLQRLRAYVDGTRSRLQQDGMRNGCLFGNFTAEASEHSDLIRGRLVDIFAEVRDNVATCLEAAVQAGELPADFDCRETAGFIVSSLQGANLVSKAERNTAAHDRFARVLFNQVLR
ncbi:MAG: TetR family transcriptional regulator C-terminal domain-containing protein [Tardiphaga sp.]